MCVCVSLLLARTGKATFLKIDNLNTIRCVACVCFVLSSHWAILGLLAPL